MPGGVPVSHNYKLTSHVGSSACVDENEVINLLRLQKPPPFMSLGTISTRLS